MVYLEFMLSSRSAVSFYLPCCWASRKPITTVEFKFVSRQVEASLVIRNLLQKVELESTLGNMLPQLTTLYFVARQVGHNVVIRATTCFNLQYNNVASQVEEKCCSYYRTLRVAPYSFTIARALMTKAQVICTRLKENISVFSIFMTST